MPATIDRPKYLTPEEFCQITGMKLQSAAAMRCRGDGPEFTRVGRLIRYRESAVLEWLESRTATSTAAMNVALAR